MPLHEAIASVLGLLIVAMVVAMVVRRLRLPYTVVLVLAGLALAGSRAFPSLKLTHEQYRAICYYLLLPPLLFEAALKLKWEQFTRNAGAIFTLALPGTFVNIGVVALLCHGLLGLPLIQALLLGAIISPTDPISVLGIFRELGVARRLSVLVEGESLFNDAVGLVVFTVLLAAAESGERVSIAAGIFSFAVVTVGGIIVGAVLGLVASRLTRTIDDHLIEITLSTTLAYGAFLAAEHITIGGHHFSGVIAVVVAGLLIGNYGQATGMSAKTVVALHTFWEYTAFVVNSLIFLLIGMELGVLQLFPKPAPLIGFVILVYIISVFARACVSYGAGHLISRVGERVPMSWRHLLVWAGLKGALSMIMVLQVPARLRLWHGADFLLPATFGVVFFSLVLQGLSVRWGVARLGLVRRSKAALEFERRVAEMIAARAALAALHSLRDSHVLTLRLHDSLTKPYLEQTRALEEEIDRLHRERRELERWQVAEARRAAYHAQKRALLDAFHRGLISAETFDSLVTDLDAQREQFEAESEASEW